MILLINNDMAIIAPVKNESESGNIIEQSESLAKAFNDSVHVIHVMSRTKFYDLQMTSVEESEKPVSMERIRDYAAEIAEETAKELSVPYKSVGLMGNVADQVIKYAREQDARYIVIAPRKQTPTGKALFGSKGQSILLNAECPVVTVFRDG
jgi:nucleotide-binding universal stress UspA family protein